MRRTINALSAELRERGLVRSGPPEPDPLDAVFTGVAHDPEAVSPGDVWVNLYGDTPEARAWLEKAEQAGAAALVAQFPYKPRDVPCFRVLDPRAVLSLASALLCGDPSRRLRVLGVTGSVGKTTVACMVGRCLEFAKLAPGLSSSLCERAGDRIEYSDSILTTPDAPLLQRRLHDMVEAGCETAVVEVSSHAIQQQRVADVEFSGALITNMETDHEEFHPTFGDYLATKARLFEGLPPDGFAFHNADCPWTRVVTSGSSAPLFSFGFAEGADIRVDRETGHVAISRRFADSFGVGTGGATMRLSLRIPGDHNLGNAAGAAGLAMAAGAPAEAVEEALNSFPGIPGRGRVLHDGPVEVFLDMWERPALRNLAPFLAARPGSRDYLAVVCPRGNRAPEESRATAREFVGHASKSGLNIRHVIVSRGRDVLFGHYVLGEEMVDETRRILGNAGIAHTVVDTLDEALRAAVDRVRPGRRLLLLGERGLDGAPEKLHSLLQSRRPRWYSGKNWIAIDPDTELRAALLP